MAKNRGKVVCIRRIQCRVQLREIEFKATRGKLARRCAAEIGDQWLQRRRDFLLRHTLAFQLDRQDAVLDRLLIRFSDLGKINGQPAPYLTQGMQDRGVPGGNCLRGGAERFGFHCIAFRRQPADREENIDVGAAPVLQREAGARHRLAAVKRQAIGPEILGIQANGHPGRPQPRS